MAINIIPVILATIVRMIVGTAWYSPKLFGTPWMKLVGISALSDAEKKEEMKQKAPRAFVVGLVSNAVLAYLFTYVPFVTLGTALGLAFLLWIGFFAPAHIGGVIWEQRPLKLFYINGGYELVALICSSIIIGFW